MTKHLLEEFEDRARKGDGQFAIAYALLRMAENHEKLRNDLCFGGNSYPGVLEKIGIELAEIASAVKLLEAD
jgi:hypothetical protein